MTRDRAIQNLYARVSASVDNAKVRAVLPPQDFVSVDAWESACARMERLISAARSEERNSRNF